MKHSETRGRSQNRFAGMPHTACKKKFYCKSKLPTESIRSEGVPFGAQPTNNPKRNNLRVPKIHFILSGVDKFVEFNGETTFTSEQKWRRYRQKTPGKTNENDCQKAAFAAWLSRTHACCQSSQPPSFNYNIITCSLFILFIKAKPKGLQRRVRSTIRMSHN